MNMGGFLSQWPDSRAEALRLEGTSLYEKKKKKKRKKKEIGR
jgi:hypothetical protein